MSEYIQSKSEMIFVSSLIKKSNNIEAKQISKRMLQCNCLSCGESFVVKSFGKLKKITCPTCKNAERLKKQKERIEVNSKKWRDSELSTVYRICDNYDGCIRRGGHVCKSCILDDKPFYTKQELKDIVSKSNPSIELITDEYFSGRTALAKYRCKECGAISEGPISELMRGVRGCNECNHSIGENKVKAWLIQNDIDFESEKTFDGCKDKRALRFDFFLPKYNAVIEYDGKQHFSPVSFHPYEDSELNFKLQQKRDRIKNMYCKKNQIIMLRIKYDNKDIGTTLSNFISQLELIM